MKKIINIVSLILIFVLLTTSVGCQLGGDRIITDEDIVGENGRFIYTVVYDEAYEDAKEEHLVSTYEEIENLRKQIRETFQIRVDYGSTKEYKKASDDAYEIIIGDINRNAVKDTKKVLDENRVNNANDWIITVLGNKIIVNSNNEEKLPEAIRYFTTTYCTSYEDFSKLTAGHKYISAKEYNFAAPDINGLSIAEYQIVIPTKRSLLWSRKVNELTDAIREKSGIELTVVKDGNDVKDKEIVIGNTNRSIKTDVKDNEWSIAFHGEKLVVSGGNDVALSEAMDKMVEIFTSNSENKTVIDSDFSLNGTAENTGSNYYLSWNDEFNSNQLDRTIWQDFVGNASIETSCMGGTLYKPDGRDVYLKDGAMHVPAKRLSEKDFQAGQVTTHRSLAIRYGIVEMMVKLPEAPITTALWTGAAYSVNDKFGNRYTDPMELDIIEDFGQKLKVHTNVHTWWWDNMNYNGEAATGHISLDGSKYASQKTYTHTGEKGLDEEYHLYSWEWTPYTMSFAFDGDVYFTLDLTTYAGGAQFTRQPHSFAFGASYGAINYGPQQISDDAPKESAISMDYFRIYQNDTYDCLKYVTPQKTYTPDLPLDMQLAEMEKRNSK